MTLTRASLVAIGVILADRATKSLVMSALEPDQVHTPGSYIDRIVRTTPEKRIEQRTVRKA